MKSIITMSTLVLLVACVSSETARGPESPEARHRDNWNLALQQREQESYIHYVNEVFLPINNRYRLDSRRGCYQIAKHKTELILHIDASGRIVEVSGWPEGKKLKCFQSSYIGLELPEPPISPLLLNMTMK